MVLAGPNTSSITFSKIVSSPYWWMEVSELTTPPPPTVTVKKRIGRARLT